jgi:TrmH family RNA methyltransferase
LLGTAGSQIGHRCGKPVSMKTITSRDNPTFRQLCALAGSGRERRKQNRTLLDGMHLVEAWCRHFGLPELLAVSRSGVDHPEIRSFLDKHPQARTVRFGDVLFGEFSPVATPSGILALVAIPTPAPAGSGSRVLLDAVQDAGNLGSILRSAAAAGIRDVFLGAGCAQAWSPRVLRAAMGAHFGLRLHEHAPLAASLEGFPGRIVSTSLGASGSLYALDLRGPVAWLFGNEGAGLSPELAALATHAVHIPMPGKAESLNVAAAAAICLFEEVRQKAL